MMSLLKILTLVLGKICIYSTGSVRTRRFVKRHRLQNSNQGINIKKNKEMFTLNVAVKYALVVTKNFGLGSNPWLYAADHSFIIH